MSEFQFLIRLKSIIYKLKFKIIAFCAIITMQRYKKLFKPARKKSVLMGPTFKKS